MNGSIGANSEPGEGSTFWIEVPVNETEHQLVTQPKENQADISKKESATTKTVLYIEDNLANVKLMESLIKKRPSVSMLLAHSGSVGIELACQHQPDLIILDIGLPDIDGYTVIKSIREHPTPCKSPAIAISANAMKRDIEKGLEAGFMDYITKPINIPNFYNILDQVLDLNDEKNTN